MELGLDVLLQKIWKQLGMVRVYTKKKGDQPDFSDPIIMTKARGGYTVKHCVCQLHKDLLNDFAHALVWGKSVKYSPMVAGLGHTLADEDVM